MAEKQYKIALDHIEKTASPGDQFLLTIHSFLISLYEKTGKSEKATLHCQAISRLRPKTEVDGYMPIYRVAPRYPSSAQMSGLEGYVLVEFTVTSSGTVTDVKSLETKGSGMFTKVAMDAIGRFRYAPAVQDGELVETRGAKFVFTFSMAK